MARPASIPVGANEAIPNIIIEEPHEQRPEFEKREPEQTSRRDSWIPYPNLPESEEPERYLSQEEFRRRCIVDCDEIYRIVNNVIAECKDMTAIKNDEVGILDQELAAAKEEIAQLKSRIKDKDTAILNLTEERDQFRDAYAQEALQNQLNPGPVRREKSEKIPDPPILTDGKAPTFEDWLLRMEDKLTGNADRYPTPELRLIYVKSRCGGRAAEHIISRSRSKAMNKYRDAADIFDHLKILFPDANRVANAKAKYRRLFMKASDKFEEFLSEFSYFAQESELAESEWKEELYYKLHPDIQRLVIKESNDSLLDFAGFVTACTQYANRLEMIVLREQRSKNRPQSTITTTRSRFREPPTVNDRIPITTTSYPPRPRAGGLSDEAKIQLMKEGKCFYCKEAGHISLQCPVKKRSAELKALTLLHEPQVEDEMSGKESP